MWCVNNATEVVFLKMWYVVTPTGEKLHISRSQSRSPICNTPSGHYMLAMPGDKARLAVCQKCINIRTKELE